MILLWGTGPNSNHSHTWFLLGIDVLHWMPRFIQITVTIPNVNNKWYSSLKDEPIGTCPDPSDHSHIWFQLGIDVLHWMTERSRSNHSHNPSSRQQMVFFSEGSHIWFQLGIDVLHWMTCSQFKSQSQSQCQQQMVFFAEGQAHSNHSPIQVQNKWIIIPIWINNSLFFPLDRGFQKSLVMFVPKTHEAWKTVSTKSRLALSRAEGPVVPPTVVQRVVWTSKRTSQCWLGGRGSMVGGWRAQKRDGYWYAGDFRVA